MNATATYHEYTIFCRASGRPLGSLANGTPLPKGVDKETIEYFLSRPGPAYAMHKRDSYAALAIEDPCGLTVYLCGMLLDQTRIPRDSKSNNADHLALAQQVTFFHEKVALFHALEPREAEVKAFLAMLLELDARLGLHNLSPLAYKEFSLCALRETNIRATFLSFLTHQVEAARDTHSRGGTLLSQVASRLAFPRQVPTFKELKQKAAELNRKELLEYLLEAGMPFDAQPQAQTQAQAHDAPKPKAKHADAHYAVNELHKFQLSEKNIGSTDGAGLFAAMAKLNAQNAQNTK